ncbi:uncharacterized protein LOC133697312 [Populus nigra]|uniref:uncharacterized protein LOC133697312 n=1 Tax=Populus nigra TaxID=3691 RepID=UPI002B269611|nr:uncharacterized protein LOC133697312 [Populus nigra]
MEAGVEMKFRVADDGSLMMGQWLYVPNDETVKRMVLQEAHESKFSIYPGSTKMYRDLRHLNWWPNMKKEIAEYVSKCGFPKGRKGNDAIWVIVDRLMKSALFLPIKMTDSVDKLAKIYINEVVRLHGILVSIVSDQDPRWPIRKSHPSLGRPITGMCARIWRKLRGTHGIGGVHEIGDRKLYGVELVQVTTKKVRTIRDRIKAVQDRQKKYVDRVGPVAYKVDLPPQLAKVHDVFHVSLLRKADVDPARVLPQVLVEVKEDVTLELRPIRILDQEVKELRSKKIPIIRILWQNAQIEEETWEREAEMRKKYPNLFELPGMEYETS